jgi:hypothetical protein
MCIFFIVIYKVPYGVQNTRNVFRTLRVKEKAKFWGMHLNLTITLRVSSYTGFIITNILVFVYNIFLIYVMTKYFVP